MRILALILALVATSSWGADFWLRGPGACTFSGDGTRYACATSGGGVGAWVVDRNTNVNTGKWGDTGSTVGAGDTLHICGTFNLPLTGADAGRQFIKPAGITYSATSPMVLNIGCPAGVTNGPTVADPVKADLAEDWRGHTWTNEGGNVWSTPLDGTFMFPTYVACNDPDLLGKQVDVSNRAGFGSFMPSAYCEFDGGAGADTKWYVYSEGNPSAYYKVLYASAREFIALSNPKGVQVVGDTTTSNFNLLQGAGYLKHMKNGIYIGSFASATDFTSASVVGIYCESLSTCVQHEGEAGSTYYPRGLYALRNGCRNLARGCVTFSGKFGTNTEMAYNWARSTNRSYSTGAFYFGGGVDRATHPNEEPKTMHHNLVDGVRYGLFWKADGHGIYIEEGDKGVKAYANWVKNLNDNKNQACFISNSAFAGNSHSYSFCQDSSNLALSSDSASDGTVSVLFQNLVGVNISGDALRVSGQAGDAAVFKNIILVASRDNTTGYIASNAASLSPTFSGVAVYGFRADDYLLGGSASPMAGEIREDPRMMGGLYPETPWGARLKTTSPLRGAGSSSVGMPDFSGCQEYWGPWNIGIFNSCGRDARPYQNPPGVLLK